MLKTTLPAPLLSLALFVMWLLLNHSLDTGHVLLGALLGLGLPLLLRGLRPLQVRVRHPLTALALALRVVWDTSASNARVLRFLLFPSQRRHASDFVHVPLDLRDPNGLAVLAMIVCITPGTAWAEIARDRSMLLLHVLEVGDPQDVVRHIKQHYERPLMEIFEA